ncbi:hypothetical protein BV898_06263 [Hypsibius exemplaris]|uniref:Chitin-binding type-2 domain-containing protein n=1 Tax=Hypsibius exemplaris TaxID=2072580 RepID=A0A1W0WWZ5_HYPEX|nr:hypothetical protein BV898_06263 [Hypsibius exemplaris]
MMFLVICALIGFAAAETGDTKTVGKFVYDLLKNPLSSSEIATLLASKDAVYPTYSQQNLPRTSFSCDSKAQAGFYADPEAQCQVFHRCDLNLNQTSYICVNTTVFNQITLVCDNWYNVDCGKSIDYENFGNSRLYTNLPLFDSPPADYVSPYQLVLLQNQGVSKPAQKPKPSSE